MSKNALIVFLKNKTLGKVKTRLAKDTHPEFALEVYSHLREHTLEVAKQVDADVFVYFSEVLEDMSFAKGCALQEGTDLGVRMSNAFGDIFSLGYTQAVLIGSDCFELDAQTLTTAFQGLADQEYVLGPAEDGGYYLVGMKSLQAKLFVDIAWSTDRVFTQTIGKIPAEQLFLLPELNDIDTLADLKRSALWEKFSDYSF